MREFLKLGDLKPRGCDGAYDCAKLMGKPIAFSGIGNFFTVIGDQTAFNMGLCFEIRKSWSVGRALSGSNISKKGWVS